MESQGRAIFLQEGCWYCHTQYVRPVVADQAMNLGPVSVAGDYFFRQPASLEPNVPARTSCGWATDCRRLPGTFSI
ncbi:MAG: cbb3-type cytochrome c oxidase subunit II [Anaerolineae bacterium]|nr:MAG: cbb3-type cytochrome c oxidase subunit II [Anaerolineae bacterium]